MRFTVAISLRVRPSPPPFIVSAADATSAVRLAFDIVYALVEPFLGDDASIAGSITATATPSQASATFETYFGGDLRLSPVVAI